MKVALYYPWIYLTSGAERSILELTGRSRHRWTIFTNRFEPAQTFPGFASRNVVALDPVPVKRTVFGALRAATRLLTQRLPLDGFDAVVVVCEGFGDLVVFRSGQVPALCICLTPLRVAFDPVYRHRCLQEKGFWQRTLIQLGSQAFRIVDRLAWSRYRRVIAISAEARTRAVAGRLAPAEAIEVVHPGLGFAPPEPSRRFDAFFLLPGRIMWTKNIELGIEAFSEFRRRNPEFRHFKLKIAGMVDRKSQSYLARLHALASAAGNIEFEIGPSDGELADLYQSCYATLFTAFNEDWGIVPLESMAFGKPVIAVNRGGPTESVQDKVTGLLVEPDAGSFAGAMANLAGDVVLNAAMGEAGHWHSRKYSWNSFASYIDAALDALAFQGAAGAVTAPVKERGIGVGQ
jgi:glycosyltransferase involved in cell wall biosynthesis